MKYKYLRGSKDSREVFEFDISKRGQYITTCVVDVDLLLCGIKTFPCGNGDDFKLTGQQLPVKNSYMFCDTLDMCFFYGPGDTPKVAYAGHAGADERDITEGKLVEAFRKADTVLRAMKRFAGEEG